MSMFDFCSGRRHGELPKKSFDHGKLSCITHLCACQGPPPLLTSVECSTVTAGLRNPAQMAGKAKSLAFRFLLQSFKGQFADQRGLGKNEDTGYLKYNLSWNKPPWGSFPKAAPTSRCCSGNENKRGRSRRMNKTPQKSRKE